MARRGVQVVAVELPTRLKPSHISATLPPLEAFHAKLGIKEAALIRVTAGSFSFGQNVVRLSGKVPNFLSCLGRVWGAHRGQCVFSLLAQGEALGSRTILSEIFA